jgi:hypothetical protein
MMDVARTSETSVDIQLRIRQYVPEDSELNLCLFSLNVSTNAVFSVTLSNVLKNVYIFLTHPYATFNLNIGLIKHCTLHPQIKVKL